MSPLKRCVKVGGSGNAPWFGARRRPAALEGECGGATLHVLRAAATEQPLPASDVAAINERILAAPAARLLSTEPGTHLTRPVTHTDPPTRLLAELAGSVVDLLTGSDAARLALCDAPGCGQLYLRGRPNQQWCNPHCGNRARTQRHADRHIR